MRIGTTETYRDGEKWERVSPVLASAPATYLALAPAHTLQCERLLLFIFFSFTNVGLPRLAWQILYAILLTSVVGRRPTERVKLTLGHPGGQTI
jgi:hypothetical protein